MLIELLFLLRRQPMRKAVLMILFKALEVFKVSMICGPTPQRVDHIYTGTVGQVVVSVDRLGAVRKYLRYKGRGIFGCTGL